MEGVGSGEVVLVVGGVRSAGVGGLEFRPGSVRFIRFLGAEELDWGGVGVDVGVDHAAVID
jgi:hypothetical protein